MLHSEQPRRKLCDQRREPGETELDLAERIVRQAIAAEGGDFKIGTRSLQFWQRAYNRIGSDGAIVGVEGLIDRRAVVSRYGDEDAGTGSSGGRDTEAVEYFYLLFHTENKLTARLCHEHTVRKTKRHGWSWSASYSATVKWLQKYDNRSISCLLRFGPKVWCRKYMPYLEIDYRLIEPGQFFQTDHHQCDFFVDYQDKQLRPWFTAVQDMRSRCVVGWNLGAAPHSDAIIQAYLKAFRDWAIPERIRIDNGRDFTSEVLTGVTKATRDRLRSLHGPDWQKVLKRDESLVECVDPRFLGITEELGIESVYAIPYAPWSKGVTERLFRVFSENCSKTFLSWCGDSSATKPEALEAIRGKGDLPTMDEAREVVGDWIEEYHRRPHGADDMTGRTPLEVWRTATRLRRAGETELLFLMHARGLYKVGKNGVAFKAGGVRLLYGQGEPKLYRYAGQKVFISSDPNDLSCCFAFTADRSRFIAQLNANKRISPMATVEELREANAAVGRQRKIMHQAARSSAARTRTAVEELAATRREKRAERKATGTDDAVAVASIVPVRTGFEESSKAAQTASDAPKIDRKVRDLSAARAALGGSYDLSGPKRRRRRVSDALLRPAASTGSPEDDGDQDDGKDAGNSRTDAFRLIAGDRHGKTTE